MMTKHLVSAKTEMNLQSMRITVVGGRSEKAAGLHLLDESSSSEWNVIRNQFKHKRVEDRWLCRGYKGVWQRFHSGPRDSLFTPFKDAKAPNAGVDIQSLRFTKGITKSGQKFEFHGRWRQPERAHRILDELWTGYTMFAETSATLSEALQEARNCCPMERYHAPSDLTLLLISVASWRG